MSHASPERRRVAAVCWRREPVTHALQFLLVRTRAGDRWTFPKGGLEKTDATPGAGAAREAWEEAGVVGAPADQPLVLYTHIAYWPDGSARPQRVEAWLLRVDQDGLAHEPARNPTWFSPQEAAAAFAENQRMPEAITEAHRVLALAKATLEGGGSS